MASAYPKSRPNHAYQNVAVFFWHRENRMLDTHVDFEALRPWIKASTRRGLFNWTSCIDLCQSLGTWVLLDLEPWKPCPICAHLFYSLMQIFFWGGVFLVATNLSLQAVTKNFRGSPHIDQNDLSVQYALSVGDFGPGGELCVEELLLLKRP